MANKQLTVKELEDKARLIRRLIIQMLAKASRPAQALDANRLENHGLASFSQSQEDARGLSHYIVGLYCEDLGDLDGAIAEYQKALATDPGSSLLHLNLASVFIKKMMPHQQLPSLSNLLNLHLQP